MHNYFILFEKKKKKQHIGKQQQAEAREVKAEPENDSTSLSVSLPSQLKRASIPQNIQNPEAANKTESLPC